jgi:hypothetical protein
MSLSTPTPPGSRRPRLRALCLLVLVVQLALVMGAAAPQPEIVVVARATGDRVRLTLDLSGVEDQPLPPGSFSTTVNGAPQPTTAEPVMSDRLAMVMVVDGSDTGRPVLQAGVSGLTNFMLAAPTSIRRALVADATPPDLLAPLQPGPAGTLGALAALRPHGGRQTSGAVDLALGLLPADVAEPRVLVLYTAAPDAGGESAADLGERLNAAGVLLAVVTTAADGQAVPQYWATVAADSGGVAVSGRASEVVPAFDRLTAALRTRYVVTTPVPDRLPATVTVRVDTPRGLLTADTVVPVEAISAWPRAAMGPEMRLPVMLAGGVLVLVTGALAVAAGLHARRWASQRR